MNKKKDAISLLNHKRKREKVVLRKRESNKESVSSAYKTSGIRDYVVNKLNALLEYRFTQPLLFSKKKFISNLDLLIQDIPFTSSSLIPVEVTSFRLL